MQLPHDQDQDTIANVNLRSAHCATPEYCGNCDAECAGRERLRRLRLHALNRLLACGSRGYAPAERDCDIFDALCAEGIASKIPHSEGAGGIYKLQDSARERVQNLLDIAERSSSVEGTLPDSTDLHRVRSFSQARQRAGLMPLLMLSLGVLPEPQPVQRPVTRQRVLDLPELEQMPDMLRMPAEPIALRMPGDGYQINRSAFDDIDLPHRNRGRTQQQRDKRAKRKATKAARRKNRT